MSTFWTMTDFDGCGYVNNCQGDTIIKTADLETAQQIADDLNNHPLVIRTFKAYATIASWEGAVDVRLIEKDGKDYAVIRLIPWHGQGTDKLLYEGLVLGKEQ